MTTETLKKKDVKSLFPNTRQNNPKHDRCLYDYDITKWCAYCGFITPWRKNKCIICSDNFVNN